MSILRPVVQLDGGDHPVSWWPVPADASFRTVVLDARMPPLEIGAFLRQLADGCRPETDSADGAGVTAADAVGWIIDADEGPLISGGLRAENAAGVRIDPGCCADLDDWREWAGFRERPELWLGHDPDPWIEYRDAGLRLHPRGGLDARTPAETGFVEFSFEEMPDALLSVQRDLLGFLDAVGDWARAVVPDQAAALVASLDRRIAIGPPLG